MNKHARLRTAAATILLVAGGAAVAHPGADGGAHHQFLSGLAHPFTGLDHLLAILAVGFWSASFGGRSWLAGAAFPVAMLAGALLAASGFAVPAVEPMIAASLLVIGMLIAGRARFPSPGMALLAGMFAVFHGAAHVHELAAGAGALAGMLAGTAVLLSIGAALGLSARKCSAWWPRSAGIAVSVVGAMLLVPLLPA